MSNFNEVAVVVGDDEQGAVVQLAKVGVAVFVLGGSRGSCVWVWVWVKVVGITKIPPKFEVSHTKITFLDTNVFKGERFANKSILDIETHFKSTETFQYTH